MTDAEPDRVPVWLFRGAELLIVKDEDDRVGSLG